MKYDFKISRLAVVCALCASAVCPAFGAASVRSLGGAGAYSGAASAAAAKPASGTNAARAGSMRVTTSQAKPMASTGGSSASAASTSRLSIGKYLGSGTSVSGGSSIKNQATGGVSVSGGTMTPGSSASASDVKDLTARIENLEIRSSNLKDDVNDALGDKQDKLNAKDKYVVVDGSDIYLDVDNLAVRLQDSMQGVAGEKGEDGKNGREVVITADDVGIKWQYEGDGDNWTYLKSWDALKGEKGDAGTFDVAELNSAVAAAVADAGFLTASDLTGYAKTADVPTKVSELENDADYATADYVRAVKDTVGLKADASQVYQKDQVYNKAEVDSKVQAAVTGGVDGLNEILENKANTTYVDAKVKYVTDDANVITNALTKAKNLDKGEGSALLYDYPVRDVRIDEDGHTVLVKYAPIGSAALADNANIKVSQLESRVGSSLDKADSALQVTDIVKYITPDADNASDDLVPSQKAVSKALGDTASKSDVNDLTEMVELVMQDVDAKASKSEVTSLTDDVLQVMEDMDSKANVTDVYTKSEVDDKVADIVAGDISKALTGYAQTTYVNAELAKKAAAADIPTKTSELANDSDFLAAPDVEDMSKDQVLAVYGGQKVWLDLKEEDK